MLYYFKSFRALKTIREAMLAIIIFAAALNCFNAVQNGGFQNTRFKYVGTQYGKIRGHTASDGDYLAFLGIPYAAPPVGDNRFKSPKPPLIWEGIYDAVRTTKCPQKGEGEEDCLLLNVFTPLVIPGTPLPVLVYIHGGSFIMGTAPTTGVKHLIKQNIIVVTINYRLGALGFLCLGIPEAPGNAGLKDQVAALKYVRDNIANFGGDPKKVTVYGMSAGGASVEYLILSKMSRSLFHQAIIESGSATSPWALDRNPVATAQNVGKLLGIDTKFVKILAEEFKKISSEILSEACIDYYNNLTDGTFGFVPCVENPNISGQEPFMTKTPAEILKKQSYRKILAMFMYSTLEGLYLRSAEYHEQHYKNRMEKNFKEFLPADLTFNSDAVRNETAMKIKRFYFSNGVVDKISYLNYFGDTLILHGLLNSVEAHASSCNLVFLMEFGYKGNISGYEEFYETINVAGHGDVVKYAILNKQPETESDKLTVRRVTRLIANYVKYGDPTPATTALLPIRWPSIYCGNVTCFYLGQEFEVYNNPYWDRKSFWDNIYAKSTGRGKY